MPETFAVDASVELAVVERSGFVESRHAGSAIVLTPDGEVLASYGDPSAPVLPRSTLKPIQAVGMLAAGAPLEGESLAIALASHSGTERHADLVTGLLRAHGLSEDDLRCPPAMPSDTAARAEMLKAGLEATPVRMNCSGKHAGMLVTCVVNDWPTEDYLDPGHPLQSHLRETVERFAGERVSATAVDGCGAPVFAISLAGLARAIHRTATASPRSPFALQRQAASVAEAMRQHPWAVAGPGQPDTVVAERTGVAMKSGAEGVVVAAAPDGTTVAVKALDGSLRAAPTVALQLLAGAGALSPAAAQELRGALGLDVLGGGQVVGVIRPTLSRDGSA